MNKVLFAMCLLVSQCGLAENTKPIESSPQHNTQKQIVSLTQKQFTLAPVAFYSAQGEPIPLKNAMEAALNQGWTTVELEEVLLHQSAYVGFPRALNALNVLRELLTERAAQGIEDNKGERLEPPNQQTHYYQLGEQTLQRLSGNPPPAQLYNSGFDYALKSHLFGYLFSREMLSPVDRELITLASLIGIGKSEAQLRSHLGILRHLGVSDEQLRHFIAPLPVQVPF